MIAKETIGIQNVKVASGFSIKNLKNKKSEQVQELKEDYSNKPKTKFTEDKLREVWLTFANQLKISGKQGLYTTLVKNKPILGTDFNIDFEINARYQQVDLDAEKSSLLNFLRAELNNYALQLTVSVKADEMGIVHLTSKDKFLKMAEKNPVLLSLRERLNLDLEY